MVILMDISYIILIIVIAVILIILFYIVYIYNKLITARNKVENSWSQIDVQLTRRADLIPNLIETVKGYTSHESSTFENITKARSSLLNADTVSEKAKANDALTKGLKSLFAVAESYPELKANENFISLQEELANTENKISYTRQFYNGTVLMYNNLCQMFPSNLMAKMFDFNEKDYFKSSTESREVPKVEF